MSSLNKLFEIPGQTPRKISDIAKNTRDELSRQEADYRCHIQKVTRRIARLNEVDTIPNALKLRERLNSVTGKEFVSLAWKVVGEGFLRESESRNLNLETSFGCHVFNLCYTSGGYLVGRVLQYLKKKESDSRILEIDDNDTEDFMICIYLSLLEETTLITGDNGTLEALNLARKQLECLGEELGSLPSIRCRWIDIETFLQESRGCVADT